jgi:hypothetical protein
MYTRFLGNEYTNTTKEELLEAVFSLRSVPILD